MRLLNQRTRVVEEIGRVKEAMNLPVYEPKREDDVFRNVTGHNTGPLTAEAFEADLRAHHRRNAQPAANAEGKERNRC